MSDERRIVQSWIVGVKRYRNLMIGGDIERIRSSETTRGQIGSIDVVGDELIVTANWLAVRAKSTDPWVAYRSSINGTTIIVELLTIQGDPTMADNRLNFATHLADYTIYNNRYPHLLNKDGVIRR